MKPKRADVGAAVSEIRPGDHVVIAGMAAEPLGLTEQLFEQRQRLRGITIYTSFPVGPPLYGLEDAADFFSIRTFSVGSLRDALKRKQAEYLPCHFSEIGPLFLSGELSPDVALIQVSPPDKGGYCSFGVSVEYYPEVIKTARKVIAEINPQMPRTCGDSLIHESFFDLIVEDDRPLPEYAVSPPGDLERAIAKHCAKLIPDGSVIQFGPGKIQSAILSGLFIKNDLGIHSGLINDSVVEMVRRGCLTGRTKSIDREKIICTSAIGRRELYAFVHDNPAVEFHPASYTHNVSIVSQLRGFISINVALELDLLGQVNSETSQGVLVNGVGGMMDFVRGSKASQGGRTIFCFSSTAKSGKVSRVTSHLPPGSPVTATRADIDYLVSEFGIAKMRGKTAREKAEAICDIAHPDFREELRSHIKSWSYC